MTWQHVCWLVGGGNLRLVVNDFRGSRDNVVIYDFESGGESSRVATDSKTANGMFLSAGWNRDVIYCSIGSLARVWAEA
jgi:hypothetical protein